MQSWVKYIKEHFAKTFGVGLVVLIPIGIAAWVSRFAFNALDNLLSPIQRLPYIPDFPGVGIGIAIVIIFIVGIVGRNVIGKRAIRIGQQLLLRFPIFKLIYAPAKQMIESFRMDSGFKVVAVELPRKGVLSMGVEARKIVVDGKRYSVILLPTPPTLQPGPPILVPSKEVNETDWPIDDFAKCIALMGRIGREKIEYKKSPR